MSADIEAVIDASGAAHKWATKWTAAHHGVILFEPEPVGDAARTFLGLVETAQRGGKLSVVKNPTEAYLLPDLPAGAELTLIMGAVRWGFALKHGDAHWMGYKTAGHGTDTFVWPATPAGYAELMAFTR